MTPMIIPTLLDSLYGDYFSEFPDEKQNEPLGPTGLQICGRGAFGIGETMGEMTNIEHQMIRNGSLMTGQGSNPLTPDIFDTTMLDQSNEIGAPGVSCVPMEEMFPEHANVDMGCINTLMSPNLLDLGIYGIDGICKTAITTILDACDPDVNGPVPPLAPQVSPHE